MKKSILTVLSFVLALSLKAQIYTPSGLIQGNSGNNNVGIGVVPNASRKLDIQGGIISSGSIIGTYAEASSTTNSFMGTCQGRLVTLGNWSSIGQGSGVVGIVSNFSRISSSQAGLNYAAGGNFAVNCANLQILNGLTTTKHHIGGVLTKLTGSTQTIPSNAIVASIISIDEINNGTTLAGYFGGKVQIDGKLEAEEIEVKNIAADYVFENNYKLRSIEEVESFIKENKHLPDIAPASETAKGVNIAEFNTKLLQKVEELTLYIIEQEKRIKELESK